MLGNMIRYFQIAGLTIRVSAPFTESFWQYGILNEYITDACETDLNVQLKLVDKLSEPGGDRIFQDPSRLIYDNGKSRIRYEGIMSAGLEGAWMRIQREGNCIVAEVRRASAPRGISPKIVLRAIEAEHLIVNHDGFLLHASYIIWNDRAILFTAPSGTGKTTQAELWKKYRGAELVNGDRAVVRVEDKGIYAYGIPFAGSSRVRRNAKMPLGAIVYLAQAPKTEIVPLTGARAFRRIWEGCSVNVWNPEDIQRCSQVVMETAMNIPIYYMPCTPDEEAVAVLERELENK